MPKKPVDHQALMELALSEAARGRGRTSPNPMVGCVIARAGRVIATGYHTRAGAAHAEVAALQVAGAVAKGADVYVNLEPCDHHGRTAPCSQALIDAQVGRVFVGARDPNPLVNGKGLRRLRRAGVEVSSGLLEKRARRLNEAFEHVMRSGRPFVVAKLAQSLDGRVATRTGESQWITSERSRKVGHGLRAELDAILVGVGTVLTDDPRLTCRTRGGRDPVRVVLDTQARTPPAAKVIGKRSKAPVLICVGPKANARKVRGLERAGAEVVRVKTRGGRVDPHSVLEVLRAREVLSVLVEGGPAVIGSFVEGALVDKVHAFVAPMLIGGHRALGSVGGKGIASLADGMRLRDVEVERVGGDLHLIGYP